MRIITFLLITVSFFGSKSTATAGRIELDHISFDLKKIEAEKVGIVIWDQREMVTDRSQPESFLGYVRSITGIAYGHITKSKKSLTEILGTKIVQAYQQSGTKVGMISMSPFEKEKDLLQKIANSPFEKIVVLRLNNFIFDGVTKVEFVVDVATTIYTRNGLVLYQNTVTNNIPMGSSGKVNKTAPVQIKSNIEGILNDPVLHSELRKSHSEKTNVDQLDLIITSNGEEIKGKVVEITSSTIKYTSELQLSGPIRNIDRNKVFMIKYGDGTKEIIHKPNE